MKLHLFATFLITFIGSALFSHALAKNWEPLSYERLIKKSDIIITGKVIWINNEPVSTNSKDVATIMPDKILKGNLSENMVSLVYPGVNKGYKNQRGKFKSTRTHDEVFVDIEQEGIWFLQKKGKNYVINHPGRFRPMFFLPKIEAELKAHMK